MKPRHAVLAIALSALSLPALAAARPKRHSQRPTVQCARGTCVTHFQVAITGSQQTSWKFPYQRVGAATCYRVPYASGDGAQRIAFTGSGVVEARRFGRNLSFRYLRDQGETSAGIGAGTARIARFGSYVIDVKPGPCGATKDVGTHETFHGCGQAVQHWSYDLVATSGNQVALTTGLTLGGLVHDFSGCPIQWSGLPGGASADDLYVGVTGRLSTSELFDQRVGTISVPGDGTFAQKPSYSRLGVTGETQVQWSVKLTRIPHNEFFVSGHL